MEKPSEAQKSSDATFVNKSQPQHELRTEAPMNSSHQRISKGKKRNAAKTNGPKSKQSKVTMANSESLPLEGKQFQNNLQDPQLYGGSQSAALYSNSFQNQQYGLHDSVPYPHGYQEQFYSTPLGQTHFQYVTQQHQQGFASDYDAVSRGFLQSVPAQDVDYARFYPPSIPVQQHYMSNQTCGSYPQQGQQTLIDQEFVVLGNFLNQKLHALERQNRHYLDYNCNNMTYINPGGQHSWNKLSELHDQNFGGFNCTQLTGTVSSSHDVGHQPQHQHANDAPEICVHRRPWPRNGERTEVGHVSAFRRVLPAEKRQSTTPDLPPDIPHDKEIKQIHQNSQHSPGLNCERDAANICALQDQQSMYELYAPQGMQTSISSMTRSSQTSHDERRGYETFSSHESSSFGVEETPLPSVTDQGAELSAPADVFQTSASGVNYWSDNSKPYFQGSHPTSHIYGLHSGESNPSTMGNFTQIPSHHQMTSQWPPLMHQSSFYCSSGMSPQQASTHSAALQPVLEQANANYASSSNPNHSSTYSHPSILYDLIKHPMKNQTP